MSFRILVAVDLSEYAEIVLEHALDLAARHDAPEIHFLTVVAARIDTDAPLRELATQALFALDGYDCSTWRAHMHVRTGKPHEEIAALAGEIRANAVVVGRFGLHHNGWLRSSVASRVIDLVTCPTLVVGLVDEAPEPRDQCVDCVAIRADSEGERWFCSAHSAPDRVSITQVLPSTTLTGGGLLW